MKRFRFTPAALLVAVLALAVPGGFFLGTAGAARAADGIRTAQTFELPYSVGGKSVFAEAILEADGSLRLTFPSADGLRVGRAWYKITRQDVGPKPDPKPDPKPEPQPDPKPEPVKRVTDLYVVWETGDAGPREAAIRSSQAWKTEAEKLKMKWGQGDFDNLSKLPSFAAVVAAAKGKLPCVVLVDEAGVARAEPLPKTPADMLTLVKKAGGK